MSLDFPDLKTLIAQADADLNVGVVQSRLRRAPEAILSRMAAGLAHGLYGFLRHIQTQCWPWTMGGDVLADYAKWWGIYRYLPTLSQSGILLTNTSAVQVTLAAGSVILAPDQTQYQLDVEVVLTPNGGQNSAHITALIGGMAGSYQGETSPASGGWSLLSPQPGVTITLDPAHPLSLGSDQESDEELRERLLGRIQQGIRIGTNADYVYWATTAPGTNITRAWAVGNGLGEGTVLVRLANDAAINKQPAAADIDAVNAHTFIAGDEIGGLVQGDLMRQVLFISAAPASSATTLSSDALLSAIRAAAKSNVRVFLKNPS